MPSAAKRVIVEFKASLIVAAIPGGSMIAAIRRKCGSENRGTRFPAGRCSREVHIQTGKQEHFMPDTSAHIGEAAKKLDNDLTPEIRDKQNREWKGDALMSEEQARRLREVSRKRNMKNRDKRLP
jgi:hypothetical protein